MQRPNESQAQAIREQETVVVDAMVRLTKLDEQHARQLVLQLCQGLDIRVEGADRKEKAPAATPKKVAAVPAGQTPKRQSEQPSLAQPVEATLKIDVPNQPASPKEVTLTASARSADEAFTSARAPTVELQLGAGSDLHMSSLNETTLSLSEAGLGELRAQNELTLGSAERRSPAGSLASVRAGEPVIQLDAKPIVHKTPDVAAFAAPKIEAAAPSIVDTAKDVIALTAADIEVHEEKIEDNGPKVTAVAVPVIEEETAAIQTQAPTIRPFAIGEPAAIPTTPLRQSHVVQLGGRPTSAPNAEPDLIIEAELIPIDGDDDAIIIIDKNV